MPEGPEARTVADKLRSVISQHQICSLYITEKGNEDTKGNISPQIFVNHRISKVWSFGKKVIFSMQGDQYHILTELGMSGRFDYEQNKNSKFAFVLNLDGKRIDLFYSYARPCGSKMHFLDTDGLNAYINRFGPDLLDCALNNPITREEWISRFRINRYKNQSIAKAIMVQELVAGIGNYLKSEILYYSGVYPGRQVKNCTDTELDLIRIKAHEIIKLSYLCGGYTLDSFISPDGAPGVYPAAIYGAINSPKLLDSYGNKIERESGNFDSRTTSWVPAFQPYREGDLLPNKK